MGPASILTVLLALTAAVPAEEKKPVLLKVSLPSYETTLTINGKNTDSESTIAASMPPLKPEPIHRPALI